MPSPVILKLTPLPAKLPAPAPFVQTVRRLRASHASVQALLDNLSDLRAAKKVEGTKLARLGHAESDLLRAAIVFSGAGVDAVLKQLVRDTLPMLLNAHPQTIDKWMKFLSDLSKQERSVYAVLRSSSVDEALLTAYIESLTTRSLQGEDELKNVRDALGLDLRVFSNQRLESFRDFFAARNMIAHELDLKPSRGQGDAEKRDRNMKPSLDLCNNVFLLLVEYVQATEELINPRLGV
ncbi:type IV conjugative transfer system protein TraE [Microbacterium sp. zg.Y625]|uniref:type IV conjugative transfer system protein TraE n=1 Tax=Microbacterium jiangjiandongii TaxID=3049071 RepID=UPI00214D0EF9|nr:MULTISPECIES: type IV conjugative transfer system protein TraE [unclassified Microbacterium]MCR2792371.1 type IV conjugative transfer system protein TraE [Microbacterium sp. zg.Y625]WIM26369.1 type IV conjugative transfer system protein TraE [Microbacterium sp. zg-Y625]